MCEDVDQAVHLFTTKVNNILDTFQVRKKYAPWLSDETKEVLEQRNNAQKKDQLPEILMTRDSIHISATARMRKEKKTWEQKKLDNTEHSSGVI